MRQPAGGTDRVRAPGAPVGGGVFRRCRPDHTPAHNQSKRRPGYRSRRRGTEFGGGTERREHRSTKAGSSPATITPPNDRATGGLREGTAGRSPPEAEAQVRTRAAWGWWVADVEGAGWRVVCDVASGAVGGSADSDRVGRGCSRKYQPCFRVVWRMVRKVAKLSALDGAEAAGDCLAWLDHSEIAFDLVVGDGDLARVLTVEPVDRRHVATRVRVDLGAWILRLKPRATD